MYIYIYKLYISVFSAKKIFVGSPISLLRHPHTNGFQIVTRSVCQDSQPRSIHASQTRQGGVSGEAIPLMVQKSRL